jgi:GNAT superfamily N-acetyltransferase
MGYDLRPVMPEDAQACAEFHARVYPQVHRDHLSKSLLERSASVDFWLPHWKTVAHANFMIGGFNASVAVAGSEIIGFVTSGRNLMGLAPELKAHLIGLYVCPERQGIGVGKALLLGAMLHCEKKVSNVLGFQVLSCDPKARAFYTSFGAQKLGSGLSDLGPDAQPVDFFAFNNLRQTLRYQFGVVTLRTDPVGWIKSKINRTSRDKPTKAGDQKN